MCEIFENRNISFNVRSHTDFMRASVNKSNFRINPLKNLATKISEKVPAQSELSCSKLTIENLEQGVKYGQS